MASPSAREVFGSISRPAKSNKVSPTARHRCDVSFKLCYSGAKPRGTRHSVEILKHSYFSEKHNRCPVQFKSGLLTQEFAHAWALPKAEIHFNDAQRFVPVGYFPTTPRRNGLLGGTTSNPISFLKVS